MGRGTRGLKDKPPDLPVMVISRDGEDAPSLGQPARQMPRDRRPLLALPTPSSSSRMSMG